MNDPWDVKSVRRSNQYMSCMKINGVPLLPPVLSKECRKEMQYYRLLAKEVEIRIQSLKPFIVASDTESTEDNTDAPELPESEQSYELSVEDNSVYKPFKETEDVPGKISTSNTYDNITSNPTDSVSSKFVIDLSLSINDTAKNLLDSANSSQTLNDLPERDCEYPKPKEILCDVDNNNTIKGDKLSFSVSINKDIVDPGASIHFSQDGPPSLSSKSFTGSLNDIHTESVKESPIPLIRQRSYTVLKPSPLLLAHLEVQSINTGMEVTSISMSESLSNISYSNKKRRSWDLESAKEKWSSMALELKGKSIISNNKNINKNPITKPTNKKAPQSTPPRAKSLSQEKVKKNPPKTLIKSDPIQKPKKSATPVQNQNSTKPTNHVTSQKKEVPVTNKKPISESEDPATRVRELYEKIQKQQLIQMANLVEKQKKEQMLLQQVFEEQNNLLFTQLKTICPKSPNEVKEAWVDKNKETDRGPVSLSQLINHKTPDNVCESPVLTTLTETNKCINYCDNMLKKSRDITGSMKKTVKNKPENEKAKASDGSRTRTHSPTRRNTPTSRKLVYETSASSDRDYDPILTDRTNDTMADLNVTFPSDNEECPPLMHNTVVMCVPVESPVPNSTACRSTEETLRSVKQSMQNTLNSVCLRSKPNTTYRPPTPEERAAATKIVAHAKGFLVRRLMRTERVQATVQTIKDALLCALQLHQDREGIRGADVDLHRRLIQQITAACYTLHDTFIASSAVERCALIAADRSRQRLIAARTSPALSAHAPQLSYRPTDVMSQSHSGVFPTRHKRAPPSLMTQSNYETFSKERSVRRYMPSPRRRPWR